MKYALINPNWTFEGSTYFGCRDAHLPLEYGYAQALLEQAGHEVLLVDAQLLELSVSQIREQIAEFNPDFTVITTAPSYLFWRCPPPELRVPQETLRALGKMGGVKVAIGPHGSTTPKAALNKLKVDVVVLGEAEEILPQLTGNWHQIPSICYRENGEVKQQGGPHTSDLNALPALHWPQASIDRHFHHHHRFDASPTGTRCGNGNLSRLSLSLLILCEGQF